MTKASMLRVQDVCAVYRLIGDCRDVGDDLAEWQRLAFEGICRLVGASAATGGEGLWLRPLQPLRPMTTVLVGFDERARERVSAYMREHGVRLTPFFNDCNTPAIRSRRLPGANWCRIVSGTAQTASTTIGSQRDVTIG